MKYLLPCIVLLLAACNKQEDTTMVVGKADKTNVLYLGVDNPVDIAVSGIAANKIKVIADTANGTIEGENGKYIVKVKKRNFKIKVYKIEDENKTTLIDSVEFRVKSIPPPKASIAGIIGEGAISKDNLLKSKGLETNFGDMVFEINMPIVYYSLSLPVDGKYISIEEDGPALSDMIKKYINKFKGGEKIFFEDIQVKTLDGSRRKIGGIVLKVY